jgi:hypothetical protein
MVDDDFEDLIENTKELIRHHREVAERAEAMLRRFLELQKKVKDHQAGRSDKGVGE